MRRWVLLRGLTRESGHWSGFAAQLARRTGEDVLALDLPGNGTRWRETTPWSVPSICEAVRAGLPPGPPAILVALSLGGMVAVEWARRWPQEVQGCLLLNTSAAGASPPWHRLRPANYPTLLRLLASRDPARRERAVLRMTSARPRERSDVLDRWIALATRHPVSPASALRQVWAAARYRPPAAPPVPLLLVSSAGDALVSPRCSQALARRWSAPWVQHPWAGHDLVLDDPGWVLEQAAAWVGGLPR